MAEDDGYAPLVALVAHQSFLFFIYEITKRVMFLLKKRKGMLWLHEPAVDPHVDDDLNVAVIVENVCVEHFPSARLCN